MTGSHERRMQRGSGVDVDTVAPRTPSTSPSLPLYLSPALSSSPNSRSSIAPLLPLSPLSPHSPHSTYSPPPARFPPRGSRVAEPLQSRACLPLIRPQRPRQLLPLAQHAPLRPHPRLQIAVVASPAEADAHMGRHAPCPQRRGVRGEGELGVRVDEDVTCAKLELSRDEGLGVGCRVPRELVWAVA